MSKNPIEKEQEEVLFEAFVDKYHMSKSFRWDVQSDILWDECLACSFRRFLDYDYDGMFDEMEKTVEKYLEKYGEEDDR